MKKTERRRVYFGSHFEDIVPHGRKDLVGEKKLDTDDHIILTAITIRMFKSYFYLLQITYKSYKCMKYISSAVNDCELRAIDYLTNASETYVRHLLLSV